MHVGCDTELSEGSGFESLWDHYRLIFFCPARVCVLRAACALVYG